jgi:hypothetical protein
LDSETKYNQTHDLGYPSVAGTGRNLNQSRFEPTEGNRGQYKHPAATANSQGVVGRDETVQGAKIDPLGGQGNESTRENPVLDDEQVSGARIEPGGAVREEFS